MISKLIQWMFERRFNNFIYFRKSDEKIYAMNDAERVEYYRQAVDLVNNRVHRQELEEVIRSMYIELAKEKDTKIERDARRLVILAIGKYEDRIRGLATMYRSPSVSQRAKDVL